jgi:hypothetical protein
MTNRATSFKTDYQEAFLIQRATLKQPFCYQQFTRQGEFMQAIKMKKGHALTKT